MSRLRGVTPERGKGRSMAPFGRKVEIGGGRRDMRHCKCQGKKSGLRMLCRSLHKAYVFEEEKFSQGSEKTMEKTSGGGHTKTVQKKKKSRSFKVHGKNGVVVVLANR